jgi:hypothetical protein|tara:strand:+ start:1332 stop:2771 length:1440 start_codon:yes stop_codon:yes gene_type:complete
MAINYSYSSVNLSGQVTQSLKDVSQYITASAGGWPDYKVGMIAGYDFTIESGSGDVKIYEFNTNVACCYDAPIAPKVNGLSSYLSTQDIDTLYVYGVYYDDEAQNPSLSFYNKLSSSVAEHNISSSLVLEQDYQWHGVYQGADSPTEVSNWAIKSGSNEYTLFISSPYRYSELKPLSSGSYNKLNFRSILQRSPSSSLMIDEFDPTDSSFTPNGTYPDYIVKRQQYDRGLLSGKLRFYSYEDSAFTTLSSSYEDGSFYGYYPYYEKYIIGSGSDDVSGYLYNYEYSQIFLHSHDGIIDLGAEQCSHRLIPSSSDDFRKWEIVPSIQYRHIASSGSTISMFDGSTKQVQDLVVGDNVKALRVRGLNPQSSDFAIFTQTSMSGSITGSRIIDIDSKIIPAYYYVNNKYKLPDNYGRFAEKSGLLYQFTPSSELISDSKFVSSSGEDISITSNTYVISDETYYAVDLGGADLFYVNDILVHS